jgi:hypothetical protein
VHHVDKGPEETNKQIPERLCSSASRDKRVFGDSFLWWCQQSAKWRVASSTCSITDLGIDVLQVSQPVRGVFRISYIIFVDELVAASRQQDAVDQVGEGSRVVLLIPLVPVRGDIIRRLACGEYLACVMVSDDAICRIQRGLSTK